jgi:hypothetical protein
VIINPSPDTTGAGRQRPLRRDGYGDDLTGSTQKRAPSRPSPSSENRSVPFLHYRRIAYRIGKPKANTATARKLAILVYRVLKGEIDYADPGASAYDEQHRERTLRNVRSRAKRLGFGLVDLDTGELLQGAVT